MSGDVAVSVIIPTWNSKEFLRQCLRSVFASEFDFDYEVIVIDNGSEDGSPVMVKNEFARAILIENKKNLGVTKSRNQGFKIMRGNFCLLLDDDAILEKDCLARLFDKIISLSSCGIIGPKILYPDGRLQYSCRKFPDPASVLLRGINLDGIFPFSIITNKYLLKDFDHNSSREVDWLIGACQLVRREAILNIGGFDESYYFGCEDVDFCLRAKRAGWQIVYFPEARAIHRYQRKSARGVCNRFTLWHIISLCRFFKKLYAGTNKK